MPVLKFYNPVTRRYEPTGLPSQMLLDAPGAHVYRDGVQSVPTSTVTAFTFDTVLRDSHGYWNAGAPTRLTVPAGQAGWYLVIGGGGPEAMVGGRWFAAPHKNGTEVLGSRVGISAEAGADIRYPTGQALATVLLNVGDYVEYNGWDNQATSANWGGSAEDGTTLSLALIRLVSGTPGPMGPPGPLIAGGDITFGADSTYSIGATGTRPLKIWTDAVAVGGIAFTGSGTSFPGSPATNDHFFRTDIRGGMMFFWNGTYWLSAQQFDVIPFIERAFTTGGATEAYMGHDAAGLDMYLIRVDLYVYSVTVNSTNYLFIDLDKRTAANAATSIWSFDTYTTSDATNTWVNHSATIGHLVDVSNHPILKMSAIAAGAPVSYFAPTLSYYLRAT